MGGHIVQINTCTDSFSLESFCQNIYMSSCKYLFIDRSCFPMLEDMSNALLIYFQWKLFSYVWDSFDFNVKALDSLLDSTSLLTKEEAK